MIIKKKSEIIQTEKTEKPSLAQKTVEEEKIDLFDLDNIDFSQRQERRRGDRRRGYRRIDDRNLVSRAQQEANSIKENAAKEGYAQGLQQAKDDLQKLKEVIFNNLRAKQEVFEYIAPDILEISVDIARKIVKKEIQQDPQLVLESILEVLKNISKDESKINIKVNPSQVSYIKSAMPEIISTSGIDAKVHIFGNDSVDVGSCIIQTQNGVVDATIDTQLEIIKEAFKGI